MKNNQIAKFLTFLFTIFLIASCTENFNEITNESENLKAKNSGKPLLEISYQMTTSRDYDIAPLKLSNLDLSATNPSNEKQKVTMQLFESGQLNITIEELNFNQKIRIPHKVLPDDSPKIVKTIISGSSIDFYDKSGELLNSETFSMPNHIETVNKIKEIGTKFSEEDINRTIATMQGHQFIDNLEEFIKNADKNGVRIVEQGKNYITLRMPLSKIDPRITEETVLLIDKKQNKLVGTRIYSAENELLQSVLFNYSKGEVKSLNAIRTKQLFILPSGKKTNMTTLSKIENLKFNLNI